MNFDDKLLIQYAHPLNAFSDKLHTVLIQSSALFLIDELFQKIQSCRDSTNCELQVEYFRKNKKYASQASFDAWHYSIGRVERYLILGDISLDSFLPLVCICLAENGAIGDFTFKAKRRFRLPISGVFVDVFGDVKIKSNGNEIIIKSEVSDRSIWVNCDRSTCFYPANDNLNSALPKHSFSLSSNTVQIISAKEIDSSFVIEDSFHSIHTFPAVESIDYENIKTGAEIISTFSPEYQAWVGRIVKYVLPCETVENRTRSSSWSEAPGWIMLSQESEPLAIAEMMVHEASHQYLNCLRRFIPIVHDYEATAYSAAVDKQRPLEKVFLGFHAFANILIFYNQLRERGYCNNAINSAALRIKEIVSNYVEVFSQVDGLSPVGKNLSVALIKATKEID